jgi:hypothetical protein
MNGSNVISQLALSLADLSVLESDHKKRITGLHHDLLKSGNDRRNLAV